MQLSTLNASSQVIVWSFFLALPDGARHLNVGGQNRTAVAYCGEEGGLEGV